MTNLSVEQVVDCDGFQDNNTINACCGVYGGWPYLVFEYIQKNVYIFFNKIFKTRSFTNT